MSDPKLTSRPEKTYRPPWACSQYGHYEHDWLDCPDCVAAYEEDLENYSYEGDGTEFENV